MYQNILLDLDGTLTDSKPGIVNCILYAAEKIGANFEGEDLNDFIGPPLLVSMLNRGYDRSASENFVTAYRERFAKLGIYENILYAGVIETLEKLKAKKKQIILATSKPLVFAEKILDYHKITKYFNKVIGATLDETLSEKKDIVKVAVNGLDARATIMVGDRKYDIEGAALSNIDSVGVTYGYGDKEELVLAGATFIIDDIKDLPQIVLQ